MPAPRGLVQQVDQGLHRSRVLPRGGKLLVAVSGGADSVALLRLLVEINRSNHWRWKLVVGHVDHGMRGEASRGDARFVKGLAKRLGLPFASRTLTLESTASELKARMRRHMALRDIVAKQKCAGVVMAHHADDQAETVLMRLFRGCGVDGLAAMAEESVFRDGSEEFRIWRPLLGKRRAELREYLAAIGQEWREDSSNDSMRFARNQVRAEVMPVVERIWPEAVTAIGRLASVAREEHRVTKAAVTELWLRQEAVEQDGRKFMGFPREPLRLALPAVVAELLRWALVVQHGGHEIATFDRLAEAVRLIRSEKGGKCIEFGRGMGVSVKGKVVLVGVVEKVRGRKAW